MAGYIATLIPILVFVILSFLFSLWVAYSQSQH